MRLARASLVVLGIQLALVSSIAAKYLYQRNTCPRVWTRAVAFDPEMVMRGRYLSAQLRVDACGIAQTSQGNSAYSRMAAPIELDNKGNVVETTRYLDARLGVRDGRLAVMQFTDDEHNQGTQPVAVNRNASACMDAILQTPVDFYLSEKARSPFPLVKGEELWVEVTVPPVGPPRPLGLAIKGGDGGWRPLSYR